MPAERRHKVERRFSGTPAFYAGLDRRNRPDRRTSFGNVTAIFERNGVRVANGTARFGLEVVRLSDLQKIDTESEGGKMSFTWLVYLLLGALTCAQAALEEEIALWAIGGALLILAWINWHRRCSPERHSLVITTAEGERPVYKSQNQAEVRLMHNAVLSAKPG